MCSLNGKSLKNVSINAAGVLSSHLSSIYKRKTAEKCCGFSIAIGCKASADYPFTAPASMPRTKKRCRAKKMIMGRIIDIKAAAVSRCQPAPSEVTMLLIW